MIGKPRLDQGERTFVENPVATGILGQTEGGRKTTITTPKVQPEVILYDAELVRSLPVDMTVTSALNFIVVQKESR